MENIQKISKKKIRQTEEINSMLAVPEGSTQHQFPA
jgi:hypothetical protein